MRALQHVLTEKGWRCDKIRSGKPREALMVTRRHCILPFIGDNVVMPGVVLFDFVKRAVSTICV